MLLPRWGEFCSVPHCRGRYQRLKGFALSGCWWVRGVEIGYVYCSECWRIGNAYIRGDRISNPNGRGKIMNNYSSLSIISLIITKQPPPKAIDTKMHKTIQNPHI